jgi:hypothetical protein
LLQDASGGVSGLDFAIDREFAICAGAVPDFILTLALPVMPATVLLEKLLTAGA